MRGEQLTGSFTILSLKGSPPLARGTAKSDCQEIKAFRITPACAGNRQAKSFCALHLWDHPRLRGEQDSLYSRHCLRLGSPPLARGTVCGRGECGQVDGITPACAGNSARDYISISSPRDHPRLRGEQEPIPLKNPDIEGSPPLARGTVHIPFRIFCYFRITPACAGNSVTGFRMFDIF